MPATDFPPGVISQSLYRSLLASLVILVAAGTSSAAPPNSTEARRLVETALDQMGGRNRLISIRRSVATGLTVRNLLEQSVRFEGPWLQNYADFEENCDYDTLDYTARIRLRGAQFTDWYTAEIAYGFGATGARSRPTPFQSPQESAERFAFSPERLLLLAERAKDLRIDGEVRLNKTPHQRLRFTWGTMPVTLFLNRYTALPTAVETVSRRQGFWQVWGDVTTRTEFGNWQFLPGGWRYPFSWAVQNNGLPQSQTTFTTIHFDVASNRSPDAIEKEFTGLAAVLFPSRTPALPPVPKPEAVSEGILQYAGMFNTQVVVQPDGLVVLDPILNSDFNESLLKDLESRFPGRKVIGVVATDDAWPHCGGIRPYVARDIPIYALEENRTILEGIAQAPFHQFPDQQESARRPLRLRAVKQGMTLSAGPNRLQILPLRGSESERMVAVYFPEKKLLYGADLVQIAPDGSLYAPELARELIDLVTREKLPVETVFAMHSRPISWQKFRTVFTESLTEKAP